MYNKCTDSNQPKTAVGLFILGLESSYIRSYQWRKAAHLIRRRGTGGCRWRGTQRCTRLLGFQLGIHQQLLEIIHALVQLLDICLHQHKHHFSTTVTDLILWHSVATALCHPTGSCNWKIFTILSTTTGITTAMPLMSEAGPFDKGWGQAIVPAICAHYSFSGWVTVRPSHP